MDKKTERLTKLHGQNIMLETFNKLVEDLSNGKFEEPTGRDEKIDEERNMERPWERHIQGA
jgi:hypothetical protein